MMYSSSPRYSSSWGEEAIKTFKRLKEVVIMYRPFSKKKILVFSICLLFSVSLLGAFSLYAEERYPTNQIELVIPWAAGGFADIAGRVFADELSKVLRVPVIPVNKPGASGTVGAAYLVKARKDGYTLMVTTLSTIVLAPLMLEGIPYNTEKDLTFLCKIIDAPSGPFVRADSPFKKIEDVIESARKNPGKVSYGTAGTGSDSHFNIEILQDAARIKLKHVPFKGGGELPPAVLGGHVDFASTVVTSLLPLHQAKEIRILAITGKKRIASAPEIPTYFERGYAQNYLSNWVGICAPTGIPKSVLDELVSASGKVSKSGDFISKVEKIASVVDYHGPVEFKKQVEKDMETATDIVKKLGLSPKK
jgi:tripartite-type tricarboxylate transporter receptor subunit TctC